MTPQTSPRARWLWLLPLVLFLVVGAVLLAMGREPLCKCGYVKLWHGIVYSSENSQHLTDWYTPSHIIHGFLFYALFFWLGRRWPLALRLAAAVAVEGAWEIFENSDFIINRYREATIALDYYGDSVINSLSDVAAMVAGFFIAHRIPWRLTAAAAIAMELFTAFMIRDNLALNVIMLLAPNDAIKAWQAEGGPMSGTPPAILPASAPATP